MIIHGCIEIHPKSCAGWIIIIGFRDISEDDIRCSCKRYKNKKFLNLNVITMHPLYIKKRFMERYLYWFTHKKPYVPHETMVEGLLGQLLALATCIKL